nr:histidine kinase [Bifidobacterium parmae]
MTYAHPRPAAAPADEVPVRTKRACTFAMVPFAATMCLVQCAYAATPYTKDPHGGAYLWMMLATLLAFAFPLLLTARDKHPEAVFWSCCAAVTVFPYDPLLMLMALTALIARRSDRARTIRAVGAGAAVAVWAHLRDALHPAEASFWHEVFAEPGTGTDGVPIVMMTGETPIVVTAIVVGLVGTLIATLSGLHIRSRARLSTAQAQADAAVSHARTLRSDLADQRLADAIAAEAHDTLAHSLSLLALNASALQAEASHLPPSEQATAIARKAEDIRRQAAGALDEAHQIIDMLRHPQTAWEQLAPSDETALTRDSLDDLLVDARNAGMSLNTWIDIRQLGDLNDSTAKTAYRAVQEGLTNARRHAPGAPVSLEVTANPENGVHVHVTNPVAPSVSPPVPSSAGSVAGSPVAGLIAAMGESDAVESSPRQPGAGLPGLVARARESGGDCRYGVDDRSVFHVDVTLPWVWRAPNERRP